MEKLLPTEFEKKCLNRKSIKLRPKGGDSFVSYNRVKVILHPNRVCFFNDGEFYCIDGVKYILQHTNTAPYYFDVVSRGLDEDFDTIHTLKVF